MLEKTVNMLEKKLNMLEKKFKEKDTEKNQWKL